MLVSARTQSQVGRALVAWLRKDPDAAKMLLTKIRAGFDRVEDEHLDGILSACYRFCPDHATDAAPGDTLGAALRAFCRAAEARRAELGRG